MHSIRCSRRRGHFSVQCRGTTLQFLVRKTSCLTLKLMLSGDKMCFIQRFAGRGKKTRFACFFLWEILFLCYSNILMSCIWKNIYFIFKICMKSAINSNGVVLTKFCIRTFSEFNSISRSLYLYLKMFNIQIFMYK